MSKRNLVLLAFIVIAFAAMGAFNYLEYPNQFDLIQYIVFGIIIVTIGSMGLKAPDVTFSEGGVARVFKVLFGSVVIAFLSWLILGVVTQPLIGNIVFEMVSGKFFIPSMILFTLSLYPVINKYLI